MSLNVQIEESWKSKLKSEFDKPYFKALVDFLKNEKKQGKVIYPPGKFIFNAFLHTPYPEVKVVILGQDPYHGASQAHGLSFSVPNGVKQPPSLQNIFKEIAQDCQLQMSASGNLMPWAKQGVLLLNTTLTVEANKASSHANIGWQTFTDAVIGTLSANKSHLVYLLWGKYAQQKQSIIDTSKHLVLNAAHPSPFSAYRGFLGCNHFSKTNQYLLSHNLTPINWKI